MPPNNLLKLSTEEQEIYQSFVSETEEVLLEHLRDLREERKIEYQIYSSREQWFWVLWTTCLAGALLAVSINSPLVSIGMPLVTGVLAFWIAKERFTGLSASLDALNMRHRWVVIITEIKAKGNKVHPRLHTLGFRSRLLRLQRGDQLEETIDDIHEKGFEFPLKAKQWTLFIWGSLILISVLNWKFKR